MICHTSELIIFIFFSLVKLVQGLETIHPNTLCSDISFFFRLLSINRKYTHGPNKGHSTDKSSGSTKSKNVSVFFFLVLVREENYYFWGRKNIQFFLYFFFKE